MWKKPFGYPEYILIDAGLVVVGLTLQFAVGPVNWSLLAFPANVVLLCLFAAVLAAMHLLRRRVYFFQSLSDSRAAVVALSFVAVLTFLLGIIRQDGMSAEDAPHLTLGLRSMLRAWWFVLPFVWLAICLGLTALRRTFPFRLRNIPFLLNHWGLFIILVCATLGSADIRRLTLQAYPGKPEWRALDDDGAVVDLPLAIELRNFSIEEYPAKLMVVDNKNGHAQPEGKPQSITTDDKAGRILAWRVHIDKYLDYCAPVETARSVKYVGWGSDGATEAALVSVSGQGGRPVRGWVSCGSYLFPYNSLKLNARYSLVMADREPKKFSSAVKVYTKDRRIIVDTIEVNRPLDVMGWKIYQLDYDSEKGRWSEMSVFRLVREPWQPAIFVGIVMMLAGAVGLFLRKKQK